jgi:hypothetical protein
MAYQRLIPEFTETELFISPRRLHHRTHLQQPARGAIIRPIQAPTVHPQKSHESGASVAVTAVQTANWHSEVSTHVRGNVNVIPAECPRASCSPEPAVKFTKSSSYAGSLTAIPACCASTILISNTSRRTCAGRGTAAAHTAQIAVAKACGSRQHELNEVHPQNHLPSPTTISNTLRD